MPIVPDAKDWTWVLERTCPECGFDTSAVDREDLAGRIASTSRAWTGVLDRPDVRERPDAHSWSPLEYACHVRDVHRVYAGRVGRMLDEDDPSYESWDQDASAIEERYGEQDPTTVAGEVTAAGDLLGALFAGVQRADWERTGRRSDGATFTIDSIARYYLHDIEHHLWDVTGMLPSH
ncbi:MAG: DinB family protein [Acidimicrobiales bacterium]